jgi:hypothetical protein
MQTFLEYWLYGVVKTAGDLGNARVFLRSVQEDSIRKLLENEQLAFGTAQEPIEILRIYDGHLDSMGILDRADVRYEPDGVDLRVTVGASCPYRSICNWIHEEGTTPPCFRAVALSEVLRIVGKHHYSGRLERFDVPCQLTFKPNAMEATDNGR